MFYGDIVFIMSFRDFYCCFFVWLVYYKYMVVGVLLSSFILGVFFGYFVGSLVWRCYFRVFGGGGFILRRGGVGLIIRFFVVWV